MLPASATGSIGKRTLKNRSQKPFESTASYKNIDPGYSEHGGGKLTTLKAQRNTGSNFDGTPQIHFRKEGFSPAEHCSPVLWREEREERRRGREGERRKKQGGERSDY